MKFDFYPASTTSRPVRFAALSARLAAALARMKDRPTWMPVNDAFYTYLVQPNAQAQFDAL